jgi:2',3'-cyclic-nucleotide 2'-phosphodiesterase (5'-nucleotidase family)
VIFNNPIGPVQKAINELHGKGINRIVCLSHNGYFDDQYLAENTRGISLIVGGHSHSLLLNNASEPGAVGKYPTKVKNLDGKTTWVVQAHRFGDYLGHVDLEWNEKHDLISIQGYPILLDQTIPKEPQVQAQIDELSKVFGKYSKDVLTVATGDFDTAICRKSECPLGDLVADAMLEKGISSGAELAMTNAGGLRSSFSAGNITMADVMMVLPFVNLLSYINLTGSQILDTLERVFAGRDKISGRPVISKPQWAGLEVQFDPRRPAYSRVASVKIQGNPLQLTKTYRLVTSDFLANGGDAILLSSSYTE